MTSLLAASCGGNITDSSQFRKGYPSEYQAAHLREYFKDPPKGYGDVPFYWWNGDTLSVDRIKYQMDLLSEAPVDGFSVSYNHTDPQVNVEENSHGYGLYGHTEEGNPRVFSSGWWSIWNQVSGYAAQKGLGIGLDDYVVAWPGNGQYVDEVLSREDFKDYQGRLNMALFPLGKDGSPLGQMPEHVVSVQERNQDSVYVFYTTPSAELHPDYGKRLVESYFQRFWDNMDAQGRQGMNYFFQDELKYDLTVTSWCEDMREEFLRRKGYDITPYFPALFNIPIDGYIKARLDYCEVLTQLSEERYFKPIFDWHNTRGLIYGCDNLDRGLNPLTYLDYFRAISWFTAPGNDAPARGSSFRQTKVSSSVAHLYQRPRTWLEAFHSMGWDSNAALLTRQLDHHLIAGGNLVCMHGLYYTTHGGWWEWAPPCFHFRMPYWPHMKDWLKYAQRMSFVLSQGTHVCDVAILYPTESMQAYPDASPGVMFSLSERLSDAGLDYDFMDYQSLIKASISQGHLEVSGERYRVLILPDIRAMHERTLNKVLEFKRSGGIVLALGEVMQEIRDAGILLLEDETQMVGKIREMILPDFSTSGGKGKVLHRHVGEHDVYMVMDVADGDTMCFRSRGKAERWNAMDGSISPLSASWDGKVTKIVYDGAQGASRLIVISEGTPSVLDETARTELVQRLPLDGEWKVDIVPTMDNRWGDYRLPATDEMIGVEAREFSFMSSSLPLTSGLYGYGTHFMTAEVDSTLSLEAFLTSGLDGVSWRPYQFSWQLGPVDSPGSQGYHGLKGSVDSRFLILSQGAHQLFRTHVIVPEDGEYELMVEGTLPDCIYLDGRKVQSGNLTIKKGWHPLLLAYRSTQSVDYELVKMRGAFRDLRQRSMVVFYSKGNGPRKTNQYDVPTASKWYGTPHLEYDVRIDGNEPVEFRFQTGPGTVEMSLSVEGKITSVTVDGKPEKVEQKGDGTLLVKPLVHNPEISEVILIGTPEPGFSGTAFFAEPVRMSSRDGVMPLGDWGKMGPMKFYSGGVSYSRTFRLERQWDRVDLDLGVVDATCEVRVNGKKIGTLLTAPYRLDITRYLRSGENRVEVLVYSTLSNHYQSTPSPYRGTPTAGLIGPVYLEFSSYNRES